jgi:hypothetical protein
MINKIMYYINLIISGIGVIINAKKMKGAEPNYLNVWGSTRRGFQIQSRETL